MSKFQVDFYENTNGFIKKTNKTPRVELQRAKQYRDDYMTRYKNE